MTFRLKCETIYTVMRDNERAISEGIRKRAEKGGDMSVFSVLPWLKDESKPELFKCWNCDKEHPIKVKKDWGSNEVCPKCDLYLFDEAEKREKRRW